jgi:hypothetical protein
MIGYILLGSFTAFVLYKNYKGKKLVKQLKQEIINTHDYYREKYDYYLNFKERYNSILEDNNQLRKEILDIKGTPEEVLIEKPKRVRKQKTE